MRVVLDTNTIGSALCWQGPPRQVPELAYIEMIQIFTSPVLQAELEEVLHRPKFADRLAPTTTQVSRGDDHLTRFLVITFSIPLSNRRAFS